MSFFEVLVILLACVCLLLRVVERYRIPYPIFLVLVGTGISYIPGLPPIPLKPEFVFDLFLPPLLFIQAWFTSWRDFRANLRPIISLSIGLTLATATAVAYVAHAFIPGMTLATGFVLGAIISPPDAVAASAIARRVRLPKRVVTILEGESLVNDATGLVALAFAIAAVNTGAFSLPAAMGRLCVVAVGGVGVGLLAGWLISQFRDRIEDNLAQVTMWMLSPYLAYFPAQKLGVSGILAAVAAGLYLGWRSPEKLSPKTRLFTVANWSSLEFLLTTILFMLIGLQLPTIMQTLNGLSWTLVGQAGLIIAVVILVRPAYIIPVITLTRVLFQSIFRSDPTPPRSWVAVLSWCGMRGVVSLAAAMALPDHLPNGDPFPFRALINYLAFCVILATLVLQGFTLPAVVRLFKVGEKSNPEEEEERTARLSLAQAAIARLEEIDEAEEVSEAHKTFMLTRYQSRLHELNDSLRNDLGWSPHYQTVVAFRRLRREMLTTERKALIKLHHTAQISDEVLHKIEHELDLEEAQLNVVSKGDKNEVSS